MKGDGFFSFLTGLVGEVFDDYMNIASDKFMSGLVEKLQDKNKKGEYE